MHSYACNNYCLTAWDNFTSFNEQNEMEVEWNEMEWNGTDGMEWNEIDGLQLQG